MIFVTVGSSQFPFDRLLTAVDGLGLEEDVLVQHGPSAVRPRGARCVDYLPAPDLERAIRSARVVVTHAGVGSILLSLANGKRPVVVPRLRRLGETVDDHQVESARRFAREELVTLVEDAGRLAPALAGANGAVRALPGAGGLERELGEYIRTVTAARGGKA